MTTAEAKQILGEARKAGLEYLRLKKIARNYEQKIMSGKAACYENDGALHERDGNGVERSLCAAADHRTEADKAARELSEPYIKAARLIYLVRENKLREVLDRRYLRCQSWEKISSDMKYSRQHIFRLHNTALEIIFKKISENT